jgi:membrane-associated phospholipid phosphatase
MRQRGEATGRGPLGPMRPLAWVLSAAVVVLLTRGAFQVAAAQQLPAAGPAAAGANTGSPGDTGTAAPSPGATAGTATAGEQGSAAGEPGAAAADGADGGATGDPSGTGTAPVPAGDTGSSGSAPVTGEPAAGQEPRAATGGASPQSAGDPPPPEQGTATPAGTASREPASVTGDMPVWKMFAIDARSILTAPLHWTKRDWAVFGIGTAAAAGLTLADKHLRTEALRGDAPLETRLANDFRYFGNYATFSLLGAFYIGGRIGHDEKLQATAFDGFVASILAGGVITGAIKEIAGRVRPAAHQGVYAFHPFSGNASFPSGETTEAFAAGSVIAAHYPHLWVEIACYGTATLVGFARMREDGHWASDVLFGALIGTTVGRAVVHLNERLRMRVMVAPLISPGTRGLTLQTAF